MRLKFFLFLLTFLLLVSQNLPADEQLSPLSLQLQKLTDINSGTSNMPGVDQIQKWITSELKNLGFDVSLNENQLLVGKLKGKNSKTIILVVHSDTVFEPSSSLQKFTVSENRQSAKGPGVIDAKGGIIIAIEGLKKFLQTQSPSFNIIFVSSPSEETGSLGFTETFQKLGEQAWIVLGFEPALESGSIIESRKGNRWYKIKTVGKEAHAGRAHQDGINACHALSNILSSVSKLTDYKKNVTVSIGRMEGGKDKYNIVCDQAFAKIDTRFENFNDRALLHSKIEKIIENNGVNGSKAQYEIEDDCPPFSPSNAAKPYLKKYLSILKGVEGKNFTAEKSGGAADTNYFSKEGAIVIDGLGPLGGKMHTNEEFVILSSLETRAKALSLFLNELHLSIKQTEK